VERTLRVVLGDQLSRGLASLHGALAGDVVLMMEVKAEGTYVPHHPQKIVLILAAMRQFAAELERDGLTVRYVRLDDPANTQSFGSEIARAVAETGATRVIATWPGEWRVLEVMQDLRQSLGVPFEIAEDGRFVAKLSDFADWAEGRKQLRMEYFYREQRQRTGLLMTADGKPEGGEWNYDAANREPYKDGVLALPLPLELQETAETQAVVAEVIALVKAHYAGHFGAIEPFRWAITRAGALAVLAHFVKERLVNFGTYQDAMVEGGDFMFHSLLSPYLNIGLLSPLEVCRAAEDAYRAGKAPLAAVEGFIRQIVGWREYVRGLYWHQMPTYKERSFLEAKRPLPDFYWDETKTEMRCMREAIGATRRHAYAHHIQRLMVTGNFALLAGLDVAEVTAWYLAVYIDAFEWVELPNTLGMALFGDGGMIASKPYAASGRYISKMSNYCESCRYNSTESIGPDACPMSTLYWDFMVRNYDKLEKNPRLGPILAQVRHMEPAKKVKIEMQAEQFLASLAPQGRA
jgi:deoxyribodipyrimidine photolyase-related protein